MTTRTDTTSADYTVGLSVREMEIIGEALFNVAKPDCETATLFCRLRNIYEGDATDEGSE